MFFVFCWHFDGILYGFSCWVRLGMGWVPGRQAAGVRGSGKNGAPAAAALVPSVGWERDLARPTDSQTESETERETDRQKDNRQ